MKPEWLWVKLPMGGVASALEHRLRRLRLHTVCDEARCPNRGECFSRGTATIMILGDICTRGCRFCAVATGDPEGVVDHDEPQRVAKAIAEAGLKYVVITSVDRDDLPDGGASHYARTIAAIKKESPGTCVEALIPDYTGPNLFKVVESGPDVIGHNVEVVRRLTPFVRDPRASFDKSLLTLREVRKIAPNIPTKSGFMVGLGETTDEVIDALWELYENGVLMVTVGQYLQPTSWHAEVVRYWSPAEFEEIEKIARDIGFEYVASGPLVRSSYRAEELAVFGHLRHGGEDHQEG